MFVAAVLDLVPEFEPPMLEMLHCLNLSADVDVSIESHRDSVMVGKKFNVIESKKSGHHFGYHEIQDRIKNSNLTGDVRSLSHRILEFIATAEASVHGVALEKVVLHEVGSVDSLIDIICSAYLIDSLGDVTWSCDSLPAGSGFVTTEHGELPLPVPAVACLLTGIPLYDDGRRGERITPTGAAILRAINPVFGARREAMVLSGTGIGFGTASFEGISNVTRLLRYAPAANELQDETIASLEFEVDDQSPEDLAIGLDRIRACDEVLDVLQVPASGKKGRVTIHIQVLCDAGHVDEIAACCLEETSTLGVRYQLLSRKITTRYLIDQQHNDELVPTKIAMRPDGSDTSKVEAEYLSRVGNYSERKRVRQQIEMQTENQRNPRC